MNSAASASFLTTSAETNDHVQHSAFLTEQIHLALIQQQHQQQQHQRLQQTQALLRQGENGLCSSDLLSSYLLASQGAAGEKITLEQLIALREEGRARQSLASSLAATDEDVLLKLLSEKASSLQDRSSLEEAFRYKRLAEASKFQDGFLNGFMGDGAQMGSLQQQYSQREQQSFLSPLQDLAFCQNKAVLPPAGLVNRGGVQNHLSGSLHPSRFPSIEGEIAVNSLLNLNRTGASEAFFKKDDGMNKLSTASKASNSTKNSSFPLPALKDKNVKKASAPKLQSYHKAWDRMRKLSPQTRKELFLRQVHRNRVPLIGQTSSVVYGYRNGKHEG